MTAILNMIKSMEDERRKERAQVERDRADAERVRAEEAALSLIHI